MEATHTQRREKKLKLIIKRIDRQLTKRIDPGSKTIQKLVRKAVKISKELGATMQSSRWQKFLASAAVAGGILLATPGFAQPFLDPVEGAFTMPVMDSSEDVIQPLLIDIDADGDLDLIISQYFDYEEVGYGNSLFFVENRGTASMADFGTPMKDAFGLEPVNCSGAVLSSVDIDDDGDLDIFLGTFYSYGVGFEGPGMLLYENVGDAANPEFLAPVFNPFGIGMTGYELGTSFADVDNDGDFDLWATELLIDYESGSVEYVASYHENIGSATEAAFASSTSTDEQFGETDFALASFSDLDGDGDLDLLRYDYASNSLYVVSNLGSADAPDFGPSQLVLFDFEDNGFLTTGDLDADGDMDIVIPQQDYESETSGLLFLENAKNAVSNLDLNSLTELKFSPNPTSAVVSLLQPAELAAVRVLDAKGRLLKIIEENPGSVDLSEYVEGLYFLELIGIDGARTTKKVVKQ